MEEKTLKAAEEKMDRRYRDSIARLEETIRNVRLSNDRLSKQLFALTNRTINIAERIGFASFDDFEEAVLDEPEVWNVETIKLYHSRANNSVELRTPEDEICRSTSGGLRKELDQLKRQVRGLQELSVRKPANGTEEFAGRSPLSPLKSVVNSGSSETARLRGQLDILTRKFDSLVAVKEDAERKYKEDYRKWRQFKFWLFSKSKHAKLLRSQLPKEFDFEDADEPHASNENHVTPGTRVRPSAASNEENEAPGPPSDQAFRPESLTNRRRSIHSLRVTKADRRSPGMSHTRSRSASPSPTAKEQKKSHSDPPKLDLAGKSLPDTDGAHVPPIVVASDASDLKSNNVESEAPINALYAIDRSKNNGLAFQYDEVVRNRNHRQRLEAGDCDCCKEYYDHLDPLPYRPALPWRSPPKDATVSHKKRISRHRYQWSPAKTPPDYWNIGFPTTQQAADINQRAAEIHADKRRRIEKEANTSGGRYVRRQE